MKRYRVPNWIWLVPIIALILLALPAQALAHGPSDGGAEKGAIDGLFTIIGVMAMVVFLFVEGLIVYAIWTRRRGDEMPEQIEGNHTLEIFWTGVSFVLVLIIFGLTYKFMTTEYEAEAQNEDGTPDLTVHVEGYMFNWDYEYFLGDDIATGVKTTRTITVPTDSAVLLEITARDVQHSFWVSELAGKVDAIPGYTNTMWLQIDEPGVYLGNCAEFCGTLHYDMIIEVVALEPTEFYEDWLPAQQVAAEQMDAMGVDMNSALPAGDAVNGKQIYTDLNCVACHATEPGAGPSLPQIREHMNEHEGYTAEGYLRESILLPCEYETEGYSCSMMPADYGDKLDAQGLADLIEYLLANGE